MELIDCLNAKKRLEELMVQKEGGIQLYSNEIIAKWQKELDELKLELAKFSIDKGEIIKL